MNHPEMPTRPSEMTQQLAFLLQQAGAVSIHEVEKALEQSQDVDSTPLQVLLSSGTLSYADLQEVLLYYGHTPATLPAATVPRLTEQEAFARETAGVPSAFDEYSTTDQQLQAFLLERGTLTQAHIDQALEEQRLTGHPLWRTLINLQLLAPQDMLEIIQSLGRVTPGDDAGPEEPGQERASNGKQTDQQRVPWRLLPVGRHTTAVELVDTIFNGAVHADATDIHIEPQLPRMRVRYRIDGMLFDVLTIAPALEMPLISRIKVLADMDITERRIPQDGHITTHLAEQETHMRVATIPTTHGEKLVLRLLRKSNVLTGLKQLGLEAADERRLRRLIATPQGMILVTGPIGSGKTTTLYAALNEVNILTNNIVTIENPVEYQLTGINQVEVDAKAGLTFASGLRAILRQDADILMVGEIRDTETAIVAVRAALTGQQLFSTLHTMDAPSAITTLEHFGLQPYLIASALSGVIAERLVRRVCQACKCWYKPSPAALEQLGLDPGTDDYTFASGAGCEVCYHTGYRGRTGIFEILRVGDTIKRLITARASEQEVQAVAMQEGMRTLAQNGVNKILQGITTPQEVLREIFL